jgi:hypothetical protein
MWLKIVFDFVPMGGGSWAQGRCYWSREPCFLDQESERLARTDPVNKKKKAVARIT